MHLRRQLFMILLAAIMLLVTGCNMDEEAVISQYIYVGFDDVREEVVILAHHLQGTDMYLMDIEGGEPPEPVFAEDLMEPAYVPFMQHENGERVIYSLEYAAGESIVHRIEETGNGMFERRKSDEKTIEELIKVADPLTPVLVYDQKFHFETDDGNYELAVSANPTEEQWLYEYDFSLNEVDDTEEDTLLDAENYHIEPVTENINLWIYEEWIESGQVELDELREIILDERQRASHFFSATDLYLPVNILSGPYDTQIMHDSEVDTVTTPVGRQPVSRIHRTDHLLRRGVARAIFAQELLFRESHINTVPRLIKEGVAAYFEGGVNPSRSRYAFKPHAIHQWTPFDTENAQHFLWEDPFKYELSLQFVSYLINRFDTDQVSKYLTHERQHNQSWQLENALVEDIFDMSKEDILEASLRDRFAYEEKYLQNYPADYSITGMMSVFEDDFYTSVDVHHEERKLAVSVDEGAKVVITDLDDPEKRVTFGPFEEVEKLIMPSWFEDGERLGAVGVSDGDHGKTGLYVLNIDDENLQKLGESKDGLRDPDVSPCGEFIVYRHEKDGKSEIAVLEVNSEETTNITEQQSHLVQPAWSPNGDKIVFGDINKNRLGVIDVSDGQSDIRWLDTEPHRFEDGDRTIEWLSDNKILVPVRLADTLFRSYISLDADSERTSLLGGFEFETSHLLPLDEEAGIFIATPYVYDEANNSLSRHITMINFVSVEDR